MKMKLAAVTAILFLVVLQGCGSIVHGTTQELRINSTPQGAKATVGTQTCTTPCTLTVKRDSPSVQIEKNGYKKSFDLEKNFQFGASLLGNILWAEIGIIIDLATGAAWEIKPVDVQMDSTAAGL